MAKLSKNAKRKKRAFRVRKKITGTAERPRLSIFRSNKNFSAQIIDDMKGETLCSASSLDAKISCDGKTKTEISQAVGALLAEKAKEKNITTVVFDKNGFPFTSNRVKMFADAARDQGLQF
ncbi:50S ribosomal protein L18 [Chitinivibrio alkaliphilus]|uniref:Large ribosomal subunit protein uL18 n=1 Tax=Chitinivibrio alkaliphilus ACht1 TaxID=1313304 RepID=U7D458_9BACT|nr:50S ribosomal protein L18 [Chitinivibrio alkaliphilus]ERP31304.1 50S ribosomal protein L18 [Chitinivibrio alkaliphilus ACht1]